MNETIIPATEGELTSREIKVSSKKGIQFREGDRRFLDIPNELVRPLTVGRKMGRDAINELHAEVFNGSYVMWGQTADNFYTIELSGEATQEQIQALIDKIESASK